jgi:uncharacterized protein YdaU (DUF1376 family)
MHFYDFNIGDYAKKTQHLTNDEDLAYRRLLDLYYDSENPITHCLATLSRRLRIDEKSIKNVIDEFFPDGINKHADEKIAEYHAYLLKQSENGKKGGRPKNQEVAIKIEDEIKPTDNPPLSQNNPVPTQPLTTKPLTTKPLTNINTFVGNQTPNCPHEVIINLYNELLPELPGVKVITDKRKNILKARWREDEKRQNIEFWERFFKYVRTSDFLMGKSGAWQASFEWLVNSTNFVKVIEGNYENRGQA